MSSSFPETEPSLLAPDSSVAPSRKHFLDVQDLSQVLGIALATVYSDLSRAPWKLPPGYRLPGRRKLLWDPDEVAAWVKRYPDRNNEPLSVGLSPAARRRGRGRPSKVVGIRGTAAATSPRQSAVVS